MNLAQFRDIVIEEAIASVQRTEKRDYRERGCLRGLEICKTLLSSGEFLKQIEERDAMRRQLAAAYVRDKSITEEEYWEFTCCLRQIEFVYERMKVAYGVQGPLSIHAVASYTRITGKLPFERL